MWVVSCSKLIDIDLIVRECLHKLSQIVLRARIPPAHFRDAALTGTRDDRGAALKGSPPSGSVTSTGSAGGAGTAAPNTHLLAQALQR